MDYTEGERIPKKSIHKLSNISNSPKLGLMVQLIDIIVKVGSAM